MSIQNEINRINNNVQSALSICADAGVAVPAGANSDDLPAAVAALAGSVPQILTFTAIHCPMAIVYEDYLYENHDYGSQMYCYPVAVSGVLATDKIICADFQMSSASGNSAGYKKDFDEIHKITPYNGGFNFWYTSVPNAWAGDVSIPIDITVVRQ